MARTVDQIKQFLYDQIALKPSLALLASSSPSQAAIWKDFIHAIAVAMAEFEQLQDSYKGDIETLIARTPVHSIEFVRNQAFYFQYDATTPQVIELDENFVPAYPVVDPSKRLITRCVVRFNTNRILNILVAKNEPPEKLTSTEIASLQGYYTDGGSSSNLGIGVGMAGVAHTVASWDPDKLYLEATIYHDGQYNSTIKENCVIAINNYLSSLGSKGVFYTNKMIDALQAVPGFLDIDIVNLSIRSYLQAFGAGTKLIDASEWLLINHETVAGYAIGEDSSGNTFDDTLTFAV